MAYDTFLTGEDELARRMRPMYGAAPNSVSQADFAAEDSARRFARRRMLLMGIQGGLGAGVEAGGGFFGNLLRGASGALGGTLQAGQMQHEEMRQAERDAAEARNRAEANARLSEQLGISREYLALAKNREDRLAAPSAPEPNIGATPWYEALPDTDPRKTLYRGDATRAPSSAGTKTEREMKIADWLALPENKGKTRSDYLKEVELGGKRRGTKGRRQAYDIQGRPRVDKAGNPVWLQYESEGIFGEDDPGGLF